MRVDGRACSGVLMAEKDIDLSRQSTFIYRVSRDFTGVITRIEGSLTYQDEYKDGRIVRQSAFCRRGVEERATIVSFIRENHPELTTLIAQLEDGHHMTWRRVDP